LLLKAKHLFASSGKKSTRVSEELQNFHTWH